MVNKNVILPLVFELRYDGSRVENLSPVLTIQRQSDNKFFSGTGWEDNPTNISLSDKGAGLYQYDFNINGLVDVFTINYSCVYENKTYKATEIETSVDLISPSDVWHYVVEA